MMAEPSKFRDDRLALQARHDPQAMAGLYELYYPRIYRYCLRRLFLPETAEDATSGIFLKVARNIRRFSGMTHGDFEKWIFTIASNETNRYLRKQGNRKRLMDAAIQAGRLGQSQSTEPDENLLDWPAIYMEILKLKSTDQDLLTLRFFEDCSAVEISEITGIAPGTVRTRLSRIIARLRRKFQIIEVAENES